MKRSMVLFAAMLCVLCPAHSQDIELITRAEWSSDPENHIGFTSATLLFSGSLSENWAYDVCAVALPSYDEAWQWLDWATISWCPGNLELTVGKNSLEWGLFQMQEYDFDSWSETASLFWNCEPCYEWGASASYYFSEGSFVSTQVAASPFGEHPFADGTLTYSLMGTYSEGGVYEGLASFNLMGMGEGDWDHLFCMGHKLGFDRLAFTWDSVSQWLDGGYTCSNSLTADWALSDRLSLRGRAGYENLDVTPYEVQDYGRFWSGITVFDNIADWLRLHALAAYDSLYDGFLFNIGLTIKLSKSF